MESSARIDRCQVNKEDLALFGKEIVKISKETCTRWTGLFTVRSEACLSRQQDATP